MARLSEYLLTTLQLADMNTLGWYQLYINPDLETDRMTQVQNISHQPIQLLVQKPQSGAQCHAAVVFQGYGVVVLEPGKSLVVEAIRLDDGQLDWYFKQKMILMSWWRPE